MADNRHGKMAAGWGRISLQIPLPLAKIWRAESAVKGPASVKTLGTISTGLLLGMPPEVRDELYVQVHKLGWKGIDELTPERIWEMMRAILAAHEAGEQVAREWYIDRILDPEVTPRPGDKASDRDKQQRGRKAGG